MNVTKLFLFSIFALMLSGCSIFQQPTIQQATTIQEEATIETSQIVPFYKVSGQTSDRYLLDIFLNGQSAKIVDPQLNQYLFLATINEYISKGENNITVNYEVLPENSEYDDNAYRSFRVRLAFQLDPKNPDTEDTILEINGPEVIPPIGTKDSISQIFTVSN